MSRQVLLKKGTYRNKTLQDVKCEMLCEPRQGAKGWYANFNIPGFEKPVRVNLPDPDTSFKVLDYVEDEAEETEDDIIERLRTRFDIFQQLVRGIGNDDMRALIVSGAPGIGKTETVNRTLESQGLSEGDDYTIVRGNIVSSFQLYQMLFENSNATDICVLDDCDSILKDANALNILKAALESGSRKRRISYKSQSVENLGIPTEFEYEGRCIFITNEDFHKVIDRDRGAYAKHLGALVDRSLYLDLMLRTKQEVYCRIKQMVKEEGMLDYHEIGTEWYDEILEWIRSNMEAVSSLSLRTPIHLSDIIMSNPDNWRTVASVVLLRQLKRKR